MKEKKSSNILVIALVVILFVGGVAGAYYIGKLKSENDAYKNEVVSKNTQPQEQDIEAELAKLAETAKNNLAPISEKDHIKGNPEANIAIIEYSDLQCPYCAKFHPTAKQALDTYGDKLMLVYRHFPLPGHPQAKPAALATECVAKLGGNDSFWTFIDTLFTNQDQLSDEGAIKSFALETELNEAEYDTCLDNPETAKRVDDDFSNGQKAGIRGTPGVIVLNRETGDLKVLPGAVPLQQIKEAIDSLSN